MKKNIGILVLGAIVLMSGYLFQFDDLEYKQKKHAYNISVKSNRKYDLKSPSFFQSSYLLNNHWSINNMYLILARMDV